MVPRVQTVSFCATLTSLQRHHFIEYDLIGRGQLVQYRILDWPRYNTVLDYSCPCQKDSGFFFLPMSAASRLLSLGKCSEMDALLDLWLNAIYNDHQVAGSEAGPVVYLRNGTGSPLVSYAELGKRWGVSKATAWTYPRQIRAAGIHQDILIPRPQRNGDLFAELSVHHVPDFRCHGGQRRSRNGAEPLHPRAGLCAGYGAAGLRIRLLDQRFKIAHGDSDCRSPEALENTGRLLHDLPPDSSIGYIPYPIASESYGEHEAEDLRLGLMLSCGSTQTRYFELTIWRKGANDNGEE